MEILVVGAGIGGLALARGLCADGHGVRVLERGPDPATGGAAVTIFSNGAAAASGLGVHIDGLGGRIDGLVLRRDTGRTLMRTDLRPLRSKTGFAVRTVPRGELIERLGQGLDPDQVRYNTPVVAVHGDGAGAVVEVGGDGLLGADVVVGADGYRSAVRASILSDGPPTEVGWTTWQGLGPTVADVAGGTTGQLLVGSAGLVGLMPAGNGLTQWWFDVRRSPSALDASDPSADPLAPSSAGEMLVWLRDVFGGYATPVPELLATISPDELGCFPHLLRDPTAPWGRGPVTLLGDAAHAFPPSQAQGANQALEDAWLLRRTLAQPPSRDGDLAATLRRYEQRRATRVQLISRMAGSERTNRPPGIALGFLARTIPASVAGRGYLRLIRRISSVLHDDRL